VGWGVEGMTCGFGEGLVGMGFARVEKIFDGFWSEGVFV
jgi:hypothetical protein